MSETVTDQATLSQLIQAAAVVSEVTFAIPPRAANQVASAWASYSAVPLLVSVDTSAGTAGVGVMLATGKVKDVPRVAWRGASEGEVLALIREAENWVRGRLPEDYVRQIEAWRGTVGGLTHD